MWNDNKGYDVDDPGQLSDFADSASIVIHLSTDDEVQDNPLLMLASLSLRIQLTMKNGNMLWAMTEDQYPSPSPQLQDPIKFHQIQSDPLITLTYFL